MTGVVVVGVVTGPAAASCVQRGDFWSCMNQTMFGTEPEAATAETAVPPAGTASTETAALDGEDENSAPVGLVPTFDLVRVEPDGSAVFAGSATPSGEVRLFLNDDQLGTETVDPSGDWVFVTDEPLATGGVELRVLDVETDQYAETAMIVVVQDDRAGEPLVIASAPGEASEILQGLDQPEPVSVAQIPQAGAPVAVQEDAPEAPSAPQQPAPDPAAEPALTAAQSGGAPAADPAPAPAAETSDAAPIAETGGATAPDAQDERPAAIEPASNEPVQTPTLVEPNEPAEAEDTAPATALPPITDAQPLPASTQAAESDPASSSSDDPEAPAGTAIPVADGEQAPVEVAPETGDEQATPPTGTSVATTETPAVPVTEPAPAPEPPAQQSDDAPEPQAPETEGPAAPATQAEEPAVQAVASAPATIDAIEIDGALNFFAGSGAEGSVVRLYVENRLIGSSIVADGRWLVEAIGVLTEESQRVRIDMLGADGAVASRAEVDFVLDLPDTEAPISVAEQPGAQPSAMAPDTPTASAEAEPAQAATQPETGPAAPAEPQSEQPAAPESPAPASSPPLQTEAADPIVPPAPLDAPDTASESEAPALDEPPLPEDSAPDTPPASGEVPTMVGVTDGSRTTSGLAIIRRGDNLWTIALRVYGEGIRYTQIFEANTDQIRNPDLIYPGQVFDLPGTDAVIGEDEEG